MRNFRNLKIWNLGMELVLDIYELSSFLPKEEKYGLKSQIKRAAVSIPSNIAEGCSRSSPRQYKHFLEIALGSSFELETQILIMQKMSLGNIERIESILQKIDIEQKMLNSLIQKIKIEIKNN